MTRVFVADDHAVVRCGVSLLLRELGGFDVVGEAEDGQQVLDAPLLATCDVLVLDLSLPKVSGPEVLRRVRAQHPSLAVVVLSMHPEDQFARRALADGAAAYVSKERPPAEIVAAVRRAASGVRDDPAAGATRARDDAPPHTTLTRREHQIFLRIVRGAPVADIAAELDVNTCTISNHLANVRKKLGVNAVADLVRYAIAEGLVESGPGSPPV
ncbi:MAG: response regulator transcription factor [Polyangiales bacterium]